MNAPWWRSAVIYQVYLRSFADSDGDGIGDLRGAMDHLDYLADLGIDAIWLNPWYPSPMADAGYDIADYRDIDPAFGSLADADALVAAARERGIKVIIDMVPNHCSTEHPWFKAALSAPPGAPERGKFWFRPGRGPGGELPPNNWDSIFGGPAWTRVAGPDGQPGEWYLHLFAPQQPDFNWEDPQVHAEFADVLRFWLDRGVDGIRIDSAAILVKDPALPDADAAVEPGPGHPYTDRDGIHEIYQEWRRVADTYPGERALIGEIWLPDHLRFARYLRADELHSAFSFALLQSPWEAGSLRRVIDDTLAAHAPVGAPGAWVLSNHDVTRHVTRYGRATTSFAFANRRHGEPLDLDLGTRRACRHPAHAGAARGRLPVPGRGTRAVGGRGPARRGAPGPHVAPHRRRRPGPGRLPGADAVVGNRAAVRLQRGRRAVAAAAACLEGPHGRSRERGSRLDAGALPLRPAAAPRRAVAARPGRADAVAAVAGRGARLRARRRGLLPQPVGRPGRAAGGRGDAAVQPAADRAGAAAGHGGMAAALRSGVRRGVRRFRSG